MCSTAGFFLLFFKRRQVHTLILLRARVYAYTYNMLHGPFTLFTLRWNGRFPHLHQNICNNHCNPATETYHTMAQRAMVADGFQRTCNRNMLIFKRLDFRCRCVCDSIWQFSILSSRGALRRRISCAYTLLFIALCPWDPSLRSGWQDKVTVLHVLTNRQTRQGRLFNAPRRIHEFVKEFSSKHQGLFQKVLHLFKKLRQVFKELFLQNKDIRSIIIHQYWLSYLNVLF